MSQKIVTCLVIGAGQRGYNYSDYARLHPDQFRVIGVAEKDEFRRNRLKDKANISNKFVFTNWEDAAKLDRFADCVIIATQDKEHKDPAIAFAKKGYDILLEKPMAVTEDDCKEIVKICKQNKIRFCVCHVMRYTPQAKKIKELIRNGSIGEVVNIQLIEPVGSFHFSHSYVRGNWRREELSSCALLAKSCHDIDLIVDWMEGTKCKAISSFGSLKHFRKENKPEGASDRCLTCHLKNNCPYSATQYIDDVKSDNKSWKLHVLADNPDIENITEALKSGPYGRCVYNCDNDVVDNQVVNMEFENGSTASFTMIAFTKKTCVREVKIFGTKGEIRCEFDENLVRQTDFVSGQTTYHQFKADGQNHGRLTGHDSADYHTIKAFVDAVASGDESKILSGSDQTLQSHLLVFAAEKSRLTKTTVYPQLN